MNKSGFGCNSYLLVISQNTRIFVLMTHILIMKAYEALHSWNEGDIAIGSKSQPHVEISGVGERCIS